jgi:hypothetical protein
MKITLKYDGEFELDKNNVQKKYIVLKTENIFNIDPGDSFYLPASKDIKMIWEQYLEEKGYGSYINVIKVEIR